MSLSHCFASALSPTPHAQSPTSAVLEWANWVQILALLFTTKFLNLWSISFFTFKLGVYLLGSPHSGSLGRACVECVHPAGAHEWGAPLPCPLHVVPAIGPGSCIPRRGDSLKPCPFRAPEPACPKAAPSPPQPPSCPRGLSLQPPASFMPLHSNSEATPACRPSSVSGSS